MDVKEEDQSEESKKNHIVYYKSLTKIILDIQEEENLVDPTMKNHLDERIDAVEKDRKRIRDMFPEITEEEWNDNTN